MADRRCEGADAGHDNPHCRLDFFGPPGHGDICTEALEGGKDDAGKDKIPWKTRMDAAELVFERVIGRVHERRTSSENKLLDALLRRMQLGELDEEREVPLLPEYTTNELPNEDAAG